MNLITNTKNRNHKTVLIDLIEWADVCYLCTSFFDMEGLDCILEATISNRKTKVRIFSNGEKKYTESDVISQLKETPEIEHIVVSQKGRRLHSKIYLFEKGDNFQAVIGSANITGKGLMENEELSTLIDGCKSSDDYIKIKEYFDQLSLLKNT